MKKKNNLETSCHKVIKRTKAGICLLWSLGKGGLRIAAPLCEWTMVNYSIDSKRFDFMSQQTVWNQMQLLFSQLWAVW